MTIYTALTYSFPNFEPVRFSMSSSSYCFLTPTQVSQEAGKVVWYSYLFKNFPVCCDPHGQRLQHSWWSGSSCFSETSLLKSTSSAFSKTSLNIWKFMDDILLKLGLENFGHYFNCVWDECNCVVVWAFFGIVFLWYWNDNWPFPVLWPLLNFSNLLI